MNIDVDIIIHIENTVLNKKWTGRKPVKNEIVRYSEEEKRLSGPWRSIFRALAISRVLSLADRGRTQGEARVADDY
jgi:hypothetical protein